MLNIGKPGTTVLPDEWTVITKDRSLSAQWGAPAARDRNSVAEVLTKRQEETFF